MFLNLAVNLVVAALAEGIKNPNKRTKALEIAAQLEGALNHFKFALDTKTDFSAQ